MRSARPFVKEYSDPVLFLQDMLTWRKVNEPGFSVRRACEGLLRCSPQLVTMILKRERRITVERLPALAALLRLSESELESFAALAGLSVEASPPEAPSARRRPCAPAQESLLAPWQNVYVWSLVRLAAFRPDPDDISRLVARLFSPAAAARSLRFLTHHGFLRWTPGKRLVPDDPHLETTDDVASEQIRSFHRKALQIASDLTFTTPVNEREAHTILLNLNESSFEILREKLRQVAKEVMEFADGRETESERLYQVVINAVPVSRR